MIKVLYTDDESDICELVQMSLELDPGFEVHTCQSGPEALAEAGRWRPDVILLDVMMPGMNGEEVLEKLRENPETTTVPVIFITARKHAQEVARLQALGVNGVLGKPFDPLTLPLEVKRLLN